MLYWKPEQPPGLTPIRSARSSSPSWAMRVLTFSAALSVMLTMVVASFCSISTSCAVVFFWLRKLLHRQPYTSAPLSQGRAKPSTQCLAKLCPPGQHVLPGSSEQRGWVHGPERPPPARQALVGLQGDLVSGDYVVLFTVCGIEVIRVGQGEPTHRGLLHAGGTGEDQYSFGGGQRRRVGHDGPVRRKHVAQPAREVPVEVLRPAAGEERPLGEGYGRHEQQGHQHEHRPHRNTDPPGAARGGVLVGKILVLLPGLLLRFVQSEFALIQVVLGTLDLAGRRKVGPWGVGLHRGGHGEARGRVEGVPADPGEIGLHPGVHIATRDQVLSLTDLFSRGGPVDDPRGYVHVAQEERHRGRELGTEAFLAVTQELLYRLVRPAVAHVQVVSEAAVVDQVLLDRADPVVRRRGLVLALDLRRRLVDHGRRVLGKLEELLHHGWRVIAARAPELFRGRLRYLREHLVEIPFFEGLVYRPRAVRVLVRPYILGGTHDLVPPEDEVRPGVEDLHPLQHGAGLDFRGYLLPVVGLGLRGVRPPDAVEVIHGPAAPQERLGASDPQELGVSSGRQVISDVGLYTEPGGSARTDARPIYHPGADRLVGERHPRHEEHQRDHDDPGHDRETPGTIGSRPACGEKEAHGADQENGEERPGPILEADGRENAYGEPENGHGDDGALLVEGGRGCEGHQDHNQGYEHDEEPRREIVGYGLGVHDVRRVVDIARYDPEELLPARDREEIRTVHRDQRVRRDGRQEKHEPPPARRADQRRHAGGEEHGQQGLVPGYDRDHGERAETPIITVVSLAREQDAEGASGRQRRAVEPPSGP